MSFTRSSADMSAGDIFQYFRDGSSHTKSETARKVGISRGRVAVRIDELLASGLLRPAESGNSTGGRPAAQISLNPDAGTVVSIDVGATHASVALTDLATNVLEHRSIVVDVSAGPINVLKQVLAVSRELLKSELPPLIGIGIGVPGPVKYLTGRPVSPPIMPGWDDFDIPGFVRKSFDTLILVDNDVNVLALGEHALNWPSVDELVFVKVATGLGAGVISRGALQRGAQGAAGEVGHAQVPWSPDSPRPPRDERELAEIASGTGIAARLREHGVRAESAADVVRLVRAGDPIAIEATRQAGREIGEVLSIVVSVLNPSVIVVGGTVARAGEHLLAGIREVVYRRSIPLATQHLLIVPARSGERTANIGAALMVIDRALSPASIDSYVAAHRVRSSRSDWSILNDYELERGVQTK